MKRGFSLVELSIVLVILGLLVGGILSGQSLIRAAELRSVTTDYSRYVAAVQTFRDKYFAIPGDMTNATSFWGIRTGSGSTTGSDLTCYQKLNVSTGTCNGDGDGFLFNAPFGNQWGTSERYMFWQHLAFAGLVEGSYSGSFYTAAGSISPIGYIPASDAPARLPNTIWDATLLKPANGISFSDGFQDNRNVLRIFSFSTVYQVITPQEAWNIDTKMDDGKPGYGGVTVDKNTSTTMPGCATTDAASTADYNLSSTTKSCGPQAKF